MSLGRISKKYKIPKATVQYIIKDRPKTHKKAGRKEILSKFDKRDIKFELNMNLDRNTKCSTMDIIRRHDLKASKTTVWRTIRLLNYSYRNVPTKFKLTTKAKQERVNMAKENLIKGINWSTVAFSDEKYFTLRGAIHIIVGSNQEPARVELRELLSHRD